MTRPASPHTQPVPEKPVILIVDEDEDARVSVETALARRFGADYAIVAAATSREGLRTLESFASAHQDVAFVGAALRMQGIDGPGLLDSAHTLHPGAKRALFIEMGDATAPVGAQLAQVRGQADAWIPGGWESPEEWLYPQVQQTLSAWSVIHRPRHEHVRIIGKQWSPRSHELRDLLTRNMVPFGFYEAGSEPGQLLLKEHGIEADRLPVLLCFDGRTVVQPTNAELAAMLGVRTHPDPGLYDVAILGAGPAGLAAAVYAASEGLRTVVIEPTALGGQTGSSSMIRNYPGFPGGIVVASSRIVPTSRPCCWARNSFSRSKPSASPRVAPGTSSRSRTAPNSSLAP